MDPYASRSLEICPGIQTHAFWAKSEKRSDAERDSGFNTKPSVPSKKVSLRARSIVASRNEPLVSFTDGAKDEWGELCAMDLNRGGGATYRAFKENCVGEEVYGRGDSVVPSTTKAGLYIADLEAPRSFGRPEAPGLAGEPPKLTRADSRRGSKDSKV